MIINFFKLDRMKKTANTEFAVRICVELEFALELSAVNNNVFDNIIENTVDFVFSKFETDTVITKAVTLEAEKMLSTLSEAAKSYKVICIGHAHIDMNWQWRFDETVSITLATFKTMLNLMDEYPDFTFGQSQASVYKIVEKYNPQMLEEIKKRVKEGRWEIPACQWVEPDNNMPSGESHCRHLLYTKSYLSKLFDLPLSYFNICFMPDTFGHHLNTAEILADGDVKYLYHCRGIDNQTFYRYKAPSGKTVLAYCEPRWYNDVVDVHNYFYVPSFCKKWGINTVLAVFGTGDHGGGATRRDLQRFKQMNSWPIMPTFVYGTYKQYFEYIENNLKDIPVVDKEANFIFNGCYSSQSRLKEANRIGEQALDEAEKYSAFASILGVHNYNTKAFSSAWERVLFNQFHDILPGSGVIDTREYGRGIFQESLAYASTEQTLALSAIADNTDTSDLMPDDDISFSDAEGAGNGFGYGEFNFSVPNKAAGNKRVFTVFNPSFHERETVLQLTVWDWQIDLARLIIKDENGNKLESELIDHTPQFYWGHTYFRLLVNVKVPKGMGYITITAEENRDDKSDYTTPSSIGGPRTFSVAEFSLENEFIRAEFEPGTMLMTSLFDKKHNKEMLNEKSAVFRLIHEEPNTMSSWVVGPYMKVENAGQNIKMLEYHKGSLEQRISYNAKFGASGMNVAIILDKDSPILKFRCECDFRELGDPSKSTPQFSFYMPLGFECDNYLYDIPFGTIKRKPMLYDVPALSFAYAKNGDSGVMLVTKTKYAFVCQKNSMALTLIRNSTAPDTLPDAGMHIMEFGVALTGGSEKDLVGFAYDYNHPFVFAPTKTGKGSLEKSGTFISDVSENIFIYSIKTPENGENAIIVRVCELNGKSGNVSLKLGKKPVYATLCDLSENETLPIKSEDNKIIFNAEAYSVYSILIKF